MTLHSYPTRNRWPGGAVDLGMTTPEHESDHKLIAEAIVDDWLDHSRMLVHLAREHNLRVKDVGNTGMAILIPQHDQEHGIQVFTDAEQLRPFGGLHEGLETVRNRFAGSGPERATAA